MLAAEREARAGSAHAAAHTAAEFRQAAAYREICAIAHGRHALPLADDPAAPVRRPGKWGTRVRGQFATEEPWYRDHVAAEIAAKAADPATACAVQNARWAAGNRRAELAAGAPHQSRGRAK